MVGPSGPAGRGPIAESNYLWSAAAILCITAWSAVATAAGPHAVLHIRAWSDAGLKDLAGPVRSKAILGRQVGADPADPSPSRMLDRAAWGFDARKGTRIFLGQGAGNELRIKGALTVAAVVRIDKLPANRAAVISKWQLIDVGRAYELGIAGGGSIYFHVSASGKWDERAAMVTADRPVKTGIPYLLAGVFEPGKRLEVHINGVPANEEPTSRRIPESVFDSPTPVLIGTRPGTRGSAGLTGRIGEVWIFDRALSASQLRRLTGSAGVTSEVEPVPPDLDPPYDLNVIRDEVRKWYRGLQMSGGPYGAYRMRAKSPADLYASADVAWIRWMMDDLAGLTDKQRREWIDFIQQQQGPDGTYRHRTGHCAAHAFCHATGALNMLGGVQRVRPAFLDRYLNVKGVGQWLDGIDWQRPWGASHDIWGAGLPLACTASTPQAWRDALFRWLDGQVEPRTGMWRRGVKYKYGLEPLGGAFHIWPIYAAMGRDLPHPERIIDSVLSIQQSDGSFDGGFGYGNMDGVWVLAYLTERTGHRRDDVRAALAGNLRGLMRTYVRRRHHWLGDAHGTESRIATLAILSSALPDSFDGRSWRNPWHRRELFVIKVGG